MDGYKFDDYGIFSNAVSTTNKLCSISTSLNDAVVEAEQKLSDQSIFMGPIADECVQAISSLSTSINDVKSNFETISSYLISTAQNYKTTDTNASNTILNLNSTSTTGTPGTLGNTQATSFYSLGDRAYNGDSAAQQEWIEKVGKMVQDSQYSKYGLKNSLIIAQIINESGWMHTPTKTNDDGTTLSGNNNVLGINYDMGKSISQQDSSWAKHQSSTQSNVTQWNSSGTQVVGTSESMRTYNSVEECIEDYSNVLYLYHPECKGNNDIEAYRSFLEGYTPNPNQSTTDKYLSLIHI